MRSLFCWVTYIAALVFPFALANAVPAPQSLPQVGSCPFGYASDSRYCTPSSGARFAILKANRNGSCPFGYGSQGAYCVADNASTKTAIPRNGSCPSGYSSDGDFCVAPR